MGLNGAALRSPYPFLPFRLFLFNVIPLTQSQADTKRFLSRKNNFFNLLLIRISPVFRDSLPEETDIFVAWT